MARQQYQPVVARTRGPLVIKTKFGHGETIIVPKARATREARIVAARGDDNRSGR